jgi:hypothetical protein
MNALLDPPDQFPQDFHLCGGHDADTDPRDYRQVWESEAAKAREIARLEARITELHCQLAKLVPMPPTPSDVGF